MFLGSCSLLRFNCNRELTPDFGAATEKARWPILSLVLGVCLDDPSDTMELSLTF